MIDRKRFLPGGVDHPSAVPIGIGQTVPNQAMAELLARLCNTRGRVLEIGTGSGYQAAVLAEQCEEVVTFEIDPVPGVDKLLPDNVLLVRLDGRKLPSNLRPFDAVLVTFAVREIAPSWIGALKQGGRLVAPMESPVGFSSAISVFHRLGDQLYLADIPAYAPFTPMKEAA